MLQCNIRQSSVQENIRFDCKGHEIIMVAGEVVIVLFSLLDIILSTLLLLNFKWTETSWKTETSSFVFCTSSFDLWLLGCVRISLILGALFGSRKNRKEGWSRLKLCRRPVYCLSYGMMVYAVVKLLASTECVLSETSKIYLWSFLAHTVVFSLGFSWSWRALGKRNFARPVMVVNSDQEVGSVCEREPLLSSSNSSNSSDLHSDSSDYSHSENSKAKVTKRRVSLGRLLSLSKSDFHYISVAFIFLLSASVGEMFIPYYTGQVIDSIAIEKDEAKFHKSIIIMVVISFITALCSGLRGGIFTLVTGRFYIRVNKLLFGSIVRQEIGFFDKTRTGAIVSRLTSDTSKMGDQVGLNINVFLRNVVTVIGICILMFSLSWKLTMLSLISIPIVIVISEIYGKYFQWLSENVQTSIAKANEVAEEVISAMRTVRSFANENGVKKEYAEKLDATYSLKLKESVAYGGYTCCNEVLELSVDAITLYYGGHLVMRGEISGGLLVSFILYQISLGTAIEEIGDVYTGLIDAVGAAEKVFQYIDRKPEITNDGCLAPAEFSGNVEFRNVSFAYPSRPDSYVLKNVSFSVEPGEIVAIVGSSGGGKSTCINLIEHFYEPTEGDVLIDGISVKDFDHRYLHKKVALVGQEPVLFARSLQENIAYSLPRSSELVLADLVKNAAKASNAHDFITELKRGYETQAGEKGQQLSGGQKQRIAIARAWIREPVVVLFDEATSALDAKSENKIQEAMYRNLKGKTMIVVAHRLSSIEKANRIIVIDKGEIVEVGNHAQLMANGKTYAKLVKHQLFKNKEDQDTRKKSPNPEDRLEHVDRNGMQGQHSNFSNCSDSSSVSSED